jgi:hypothetical protein
MNIKKLSSQELINYARELIIDLVSIGQLAKKWHQSKFVKMEPSIYNHKESWKIIFQLGSDRESSDEMRVLFLYFSPQGTHEASHFND